MEWSGRKEEFVKRAGFVLMAAVSIHDKNTGDIEFIKLLPLKNIILRITETLLKKPLIGH